jgi:acetyl-CoA carboxylase biotin carboxylase subunit
MFKRVLVANRGEIAVRIIRALRELGIQSVAVYSEADAPSLHVQLADEAVNIGFSEPVHSYLNFSHLMSTAMVTGADAVHPGYGFLAENSDFVDACTQNDLTFIGPSASAMRAMGDKVEAKRIMREAGVPVIPGVETSLSGVEEALRIARDIGYPVMLKAQGGGGGRGMRIVREESALESAYRTAENEAQTAFGDPRLYLEKLIVNPRHIEFQILADEHGNVIHLGERECSIQRRHQKLLEEAPSPVITDEMRSRIASAAIQAVRNLGYSSCGTMEFLMDGNGDFHFIEMNTRVQVEHPITEEITGVDILKAQILAAAGEPLGISQDDVTLSGHAIEVRVNAEDPDRDFSPCPGTIERLHLPGGPGIRVDTHVYQGYSIPPHYDSLIAKVIAYGRTRDEAITRMSRALDETVIEGVKTTIPFHRTILEHPDFRSGNFHTGFISRIAS